MKSHLSRKLFASILAQIIRYGAPLTFYPFLTRALGAEGFAEFALSSTIALMLGQIIEFGFGLSGVRELAEAPNERRAASGVVGDVFFGRLVVAIAAFSGAIALWHWAPDSVANDPVIAAAIGALALGYGFSSSWYFIGRERTGVLAGLETITSFAQLFLLVAFLGSGRATLAIWLMAIPVWMVAIVGNVLAVKELGIEAPPPRRLWVKLGESFQFFCFTGAMPFLNRANLLVLSAFSSPQQVAYFAVGERIVTAAANATVPITRVIMPRITALRATSPSQARRLFQNTTSALFLLASAGALVGAALAPVGVPWIFGRDVAAAAPVVAAQLFMVPAMFLSRSLGTFALVPLRLEGIYQRVVIAAAAVGLALAPIAIHFGAALALAITRVAIELAAAVACLVAVSRIGSWERPDDPQLS